LSKEWADRYWTMHWVPIALRQAYENLWRGYWTKDRFMYALHIADIHPMWREDIYRVAFRAPTVRELGYGFDVGEYTVEDIIKYRRWGGLSLEDATKAAKAMVAYRLEAERTELRRDAIADLVAGLDSEATLRAELEAIGGRKELVDLWVERAKWRAEREMVLTEIDLWKRACIKGRITKNELNDKLLELGIQDWKRHQILAEVDLRKRVDVEEVRVLTPAQIGRLYRLGKMPYMEALRRLLDQNYPEDEARYFLMLYEPKEGGD